MLYGPPTQYLSMHEAKATRAATAASAFGRPGRGAGLVLEAAARTWRGSAEPSKGRAFAMAFAAAAGLSLSLAGMWAAWGVLSQ